MTHYTVKDCQLALQRATHPDGHAGYDIGPEGADGQFGAHTQNALLLFQSEHPPLALTGRFDKPTLRLLFPPAPAGINPFTDLALRVGLKLLVNQLFPGKDIDMDSITATVKSAWASKLNWTMALGVVFNIFMLFGHPVPPDVQAAVLAVGNGAVLVVGWVIRTWFTTSITTASAKKL